MIRPDAHKSLLRFSTAGSVDDGKSTLIGRLLYDSDGLYEDQLESVRRASRETLDLSLITDGLRAEREQAITIDVAYRYFSTSRRTFIIADTPGHEQYTRNMATGASTVDLAVILVDARRGVVEQTRRHTYIAWLFGIRRIVVAVNKMDLVSYDQEVFLSICQSFIQCTAPLSLAKASFVPISALRGDNVVRRTRSMSWYEGPTLLELLETIPIEEECNVLDFRFPVQSVIRAHQDYRGYAGQVASGIVEPNWEVVALPSGQRSRVESICLHSRSLARAFPPLSIVMTLARDLDLGRGDMLADPDRMPAITKRITATLIWMSLKPLRMSAPYLIKHTTQVLCGSVTRIFHRIDVQNFDKIETAALKLNDIAVVQLETHKPMFCDPYISNRITGSFIVIDPVDNATVAAGMVLESSLASARGTDPQRNENIASDSSHERKTGLTVWCTGLSGSGKTTICSAVCTELLARGFRVEILDGDVLRRHLNSDLGFTKSERDENIRRIGFVADLLSRNGVVVLVSAISPYRAVREEVRSTIVRFLEVYVNAPLEVCEQRDPKGLYKKVRAGKLRGFTGVDDPYEAPLKPDIQCDTHRESVSASTSKVLEGVLSFFSSRQVS